MDRLDCERMFVAVLDCGSFAGAAARLGTSSGQASKLVSKLEADLGVQLIKRTTRALSPTEVGQAYFARMKPLLDEFAALDASVRNASGLPAGRLRLTAPMSFGVHCLAPALLRFAETFPDIQLDVSFTDRIVSIVDEGYDIAVRIGKLEDSSLIARRLCDARIVVVAAASYIEKRGRPSAPSDLEQHECIIDTNFRDPFKWRFSSAKADEPETVTVSGRLHFSSGDACLAAALSGLGVSRVPSFIAGPLIRDKRVQVLFAHAEDEALAVHALYPPARHLALKVRSLIDFLADSYHGQPAWDEGW